MPGAPYTWVNAVEALSTWAKEISSGPTPACLKAAWAAATLGLSQRSGDSHELNTSKLPNGRLRNTADFKNTGRAG